MYRYNLFATLLILITACTSDVQISEEIARLENLTVIPQDAEPSHTINLEKEAVYRDTEDIILGRFSGAVADDEGRVFIADRDQNIIHVYEPGGEYLRQLGREGDGPGEFGNISSMLADDQFIYAYDFSKRSLNVFDLESLEFSHVIPLFRKDRDIEELEGTYPGPFYVRNDSNLLVSFKKPYSSSNLNDQVRTTLFYLLDREGRIVSDLIFEHRDKEALINSEGNSFMIMNTSYSPGPLVDSGYDNSLYFAWTEEFLIKVYNGKGEYERAIYHPYDKSPLDRNEVVNEYEGETQRKMIRNDDLPETWPALNSLTVDDENRLWVSTITDDREVYQWWLISNEGELMARFQWPESRRPVEIKNGYLYARETEEETGLQQVVRYRIELL